MLRHSFCGRLVKLFLFPTLLDKSPLTSVYFTTFENKREVRSPLTHNQTFWFLVNNNIYNFCVEVFEKTINRTKMIDPSFERYNNGVCYRLYKNIVRGYCCERRALET